MILNIGLLHVIRKWYWLEVEAPRRIANSLKQWQSQEQKRRENRKKLQQIQSDESDDSDFEDEDERIGGAVGDITTVCFMYLD